MHNFVSVPIEFDRVARTRAGVEAARFSNGSVTYGGLNAMANRAARVLHDPALRGSPVAVLLPKGPAWLAAILGAMKAGRTVTFLDPDQPKERLESHLADLGDGATVIRDTDVARWADGGYCEYALSPPNPLAMIWYTSGSSGAPKGVMLPHAGILHNALKPGTAWLRSDDRILVTTLHAGSLFGSLLSGGTTIFATSTDDIAAAASLIPRERISVIFSTMSIFRRLARLLTPEETRTVRSVSMGSEPLDAGDVTLFRQAFSAGAVPRLTYGSSEAFEITAVQHASLETGDGPQHSGTPVPGKEVIIAPDGEILVRSRYLASGYWRNPEATAARFKADPASEDEVIYHTGDLGELLPGGELVVKGRKDSLVKIRGSFISLSAVEAAARSIPGVKEAAARVFPGPAGNRLAAWVELESGVEARPMDFRESYRNRFPGLEPPDVFTIVAEWPRTPSGKIDRNRLSEPDWATRSSPGHQEAPVDAVEELICSIWAEVLGIDGIGRNDDFLALAGNSLDAAAIAARLSRVLFLQVSPALLLESGTPARLAEALGTLPMDPEIAAALEEAERSR